MKKVITATVGPALISGALLGAGAANAADSNTMFRTQSGKVRCFVSASEPQRAGARAAVCETYADETNWAFPQAPLITYAPGSSGRANIAGVDDGGELRWHLGDIPGANNAQDIAMQYGQTYHANGWTICASSDGTRLTNDRTGHGMFVSIQNVSSF